MKIAHRMTIVLDEAHKYLTNSDADRFNQSICNIIRQQRHLAVAARVIISTQEPTVVPLLDLMSYIIYHRFSFSWFRHLRTSRLTRRLPLELSHGTMPSLIRVVEVVTGTILLTAGLVMVLCWRGVDLLFLILHSLAVCTHFPFP